MTTRQASAHGMGLEDINGIDEVFLSLSVPTTHQSFGGVRILVHAECLPMLVSSAAAEEGLV